MGYLANVRTALKVRKLLKLGKKMTKEQKLAQIEIGMEYIETEWIQQFPRAAQVEALKQIRKKVDKLKQDVKDGKR